MSEPRQNRVNPLGDLIATPERGLVYGNRGCLHDTSGRIRRRFAVHRWIACRLTFRARRHPLMAPGRYTGLFFLDEATAWAAGHRPCAECRHSDWRRFGDLWAEHIDPDRRAPSVDARLHAERWDAMTGRARIHTAHAENLPDGAFVITGAQPHVVLGDQILRWTPAGYRDPRPRPTGVVQVITPPSLLTVLRHGWTSAVLPWLHPSS